MAIKKFLSESGFKHFVEKVIGKTDISAVGDGTLKGAVAEINTDLSVLNKSITDINTHLSENNFSHPNNIDGLYTQDASVINQWTYWGVLCVWGTNVNGLMPQYYNRVICMGAIQIDLTADNHFYVRNHVNNAWTAWIEK